jgi:hypothetical protein
VVRDFLMPLTLRPWTCWKAAPSADAVPLSVPTDQLPLVKIKVNLTPEEWNPNNQTANRSFTSFASTIRYNSVVFGFEGELGARGLRISQA